MRGFISRYWEYVKDFGLNILASMVVTLATAVIVNPLLALKYSEEKYGMILTLCACGSVLSNMFGNTLNNVRLINKKGSGNNYNFLISCVSVLAAVSMFVLSMTFYVIDALTSFLLGVHVLLTTVNLYFSVTYRIEIDYVKNLKYCLIVSAAYLAGIVLFLVSNVWAFIYICSDLAGTIYLRKTSFLFTDSFKIDEAIKPIFRQYITLIFTSLIGQALLYLDRFIIYPLLGGDSVATYSTASFIGKSLSVLMTPIASVLLSYYSDQSYAMRKRDFWKINGMLLGVGVIFVGISLLFAPLVTKLLYPTLYGEAKQYLFMANLAVTINILGSMTNPFILRFCASKWQMVITGVYGTVYVFLGIAFIKHFDLWGFAVASIIANAVRLLMMYLAGNVSLAKPQKAYNGE